MPSFIPPPVLTAQPIIFIPPTFFGVTSGVLGDHVVTGGLTFSFPSGPVPVSVAAEANVLTGFAQGGHNTITGFANQALGDAVTMDGFAKAGGNTVTTNGGLGPGYAMGEAFTMTGFARGGFNTVSSVARGDQAALGDAVFMSGFAQGGHNHVTGGARLQTFLYGDAEFMSNFASGGHNTLTGSDTNPSVMFGDAFELSGFAHGGGNLLIAASDLTTPPGFNLMYGDGYELNGFASGGGNTLVSGNSKDIMYGDAAIVSPFAHTSANTFEFMPQNGADQIMDFHSGRDHIDLQGFGFSSFAQVAPLIQQTAHGALVAFDANDSILVFGVNQLTANDFVFS